jgi:hypothetical protein
VTTEAAAAEREAAEAARHRGEEQQLGARVAELERSEADLQVRRGIYSDEKVASCSVRGFRVGDGSHRRFATPARFIRHECSPAPRASKSTSAANVWAWSVARPGVAVAQLARLHPLGRSSPAPVSP